jgi:hypothetical protein
MGDEPVERRWTLFACVDRPTGAEYCRWRGCELGTAVSLKSQSGRAEQRMGLPTRTGRFEAGSIPKAALDAVRFEGAVLGASGWPG